MKIMEITVITEMDDSSILSAHWYSGLDLQGKPAGQMPGSPTTRGAKTSLE
jgi:hypothetical protein